MTKRKRCVTRDITYSILQCVGVAKSRGFDNHAGRSEGTTATVDRAGLYYNIEYHICVLWDGSVSGSRSGLATYD